MISEMIKNAPPESETVPENEALPENETVPENGAPPEKTDAPGEPETESRHDDGNALVAENTTVATASLMKKVRRFTYRRTLLCYVFLTAGGLVFTALCVVLRMLDKSFFANLHYLELVSGGVIVFLGIVGMISIINAMRPGPADDPPRVTRSLFLEDRIIVEGEEQDTVLYYSELYRVTRSGDVVYFIFRRGGAREIFFVDERGFDKYASKDFGGHANIREFLKAKGYSVR